MPLEIRILTGARAGVIQRFDQAVIRVGRQPGNDLLFDPEQDLDVSGRHAEIREGNGRYTIQDHGSTNGTFVNGTRVQASAELKNGDRIAFGGQGPLVEVRVRAASDAPMKQSTEMRVAVAVKQQTASLRRAMLALLAVLVVGAGGAIVFSRRQSQERLELLQRQIAASDSMIAQLQGSMGASVDTALVNEMRRKIVALQQRLPGAGAAGERERIERAIAEHQRQLSRMDRMDLPSIHRNNAPAVAIIISDIGGRIAAGSGFSISADGVLLTNRHNVRDSLGRMASRIAVKFTNTRDWLPAHIVTVESGDADLALIRMTRGGVFPAVSGVSTGAAAATEGMSVVTIGYPLGYETPMEGAGNDFEAKSTLNPGIVSKRTSSVLQIDSYATHGSSGSPVFNTRGFVVGVVYGGLREAGGRMVYAVPAEKIAAFLPAQYKSIVRE